PNPFWWGQEPGLQNGGNHPIGKNPDHTATIGGIAPRGHTARSKGGNRTKVERNHGNRCPKDSQGCNSFPFHTLWGPLGRHGGGPRKPCGPRVGRIGGLEHPSLSRTGDNFSYSLSKFHKKLVWIIY